MKRYTEAVLLFSLLLSFCISVHAFGPTGHRICAGLAEEFLNETSRKEIRKILGTESLIEASTWADEMRSDPSDFWQKQANYFHYVTVPSGKTYSEMALPLHGDAVSALASFREVLKNPNSKPEEKALALRFTVHIIADLHQPLHVGNGEDKGGNTIKLKFFDKNTNLHAIWDSGLINTQELSYSEWVNLLLPSIGQEQKITWSSVDPLDWIAESQQLRETIYPTKKKISWEYQFQHLPALKQRLQQGGYRTALYLNVLFAN